MKGVFNMTRIISVFLAVLLVFSICGCNKKADSKMNDDFLSRILEIDDGQYSAEKDFNHTNLISADPVLTVETTVQTTNNITLNDINLSLTYKDTAYFPLGDKLVYRYCVDGDDSKVIDIDMNGNLNRIRYKYITLDISKTATPEEVLTKLRPELEKIRDLSQYEFIKLPEQRESKEGFGSYGFLFYNMEGKYGIDYLYVAVFDDGGVTGLYIYDLPDEKRNFTVNEDKLNDIIEAKLRSIYDTNDSKYVSFKKYGDYDYLTVYNGEYYLDCSVVPKFIRNGHETSGFVISLLVPLDLIID